MLKRKIDPLNASLIPPDLANSSVEDIRVLNAISSLRKLADKIDVPPFKGRTTIILPSKRYQYWREGLLAWFCYLFYYYYPPRQSKHPSRWEVISYVCCVFTYFIGVDTELVFSIHGAAQLATRLWIETNYDTERSRYSLYYGWWAPFIQMIIEVDSVSGGRDWSLCTSDQNNIYDVECVNDQSILNLILKRLKSSTGTENCSHQRYSQLLHIMTCFHPPSEVGRPYNRTIKTITSTANALYIRSQQSFIKGDADLAFTMADSGASAFFALSLALKDVHSVNAVIVSIRAGLLPALYWTSTLLFEPNTDGLRREYVMKIIREIVPMYMVFGSVLSALQENIGVGRLRTSVSSGPWFDEWKAFHTLLSEKLEILKQEGPMLTFCDNMKHDRSLRPKEASRKCSGCKSSWYCSKKCQIEDWKDVHRHQCRTLRDQNEDTPRLCRVDHYSVCRFAIHKVKTRWNDIIELATAQYPQNQLSQLAIVINCMVYPHKIEVEPRNDADEKYGGGSIKIIRCRVTLGAYIATIMMVGDIDDESKTWLTGKSWCKFHALATK